MVVIEAERFTPYDTYTEMIYELMSAYTELRDHVSIERYGLPFSSFEENSSKWLEIRDMVSKRISIAERVDYENSV